MNFRIWNKNLIFFIIKISGIFYSSPSNFNYWYNFGVLALYFLIAQVVSGIILAMFYNANTNISFISIITLNNEIYYGWWLRALHLNGASWFFIVVYLHMFKAIYYGSYAFPRHLLWVSGVLIWILMIATAFLGYVLPWGQMSFWAAMVITSLLGALPLIGNDLLLLLWGSYSIDDVTVHRFYSLHFTLPFIIIALVILHLLFLHEFGSSNPLGFISKLDNAPLFPYYSLKDFFSIIIILIFFFIIIFLSPDLLGHSDNYIEANSLVTPAHIVPEWYFLPLYAVLRSVTSKLLGILLIALFIACLLFLPFLNLTLIIRSGIFKPFFVFLFWFFLIICLLLGWLGSLPVITPYIIIGQFLTFLYFIILLILFPLNNFFEKFIFDLFLIRHYLFNSSFDGFKNFLKLKNSTLSFYLT